jgi:uncharacterized membrane protein YgaE (UPF0421/DUF939 family)
MSIKYSLQQINSDYKILLTNHTWACRASKRAVKVAIAVIISVLIANKLNLGMPYWAAMSAIFSMQASTTGSTLRIGLLYRTGGTIFGAILGIIILGFVIQNFTLLNLSIFIVLTISFYLKNRSDHAAFWVLFGVTVFLIIIVGNDSLPYDTLVFAFNRCSEIIIGAITACLVDVCIWPLHASESYSKQLKELKFNYCQAIKDAFQIHLDRKNTDIEKCLVNIENVNNNIKTLKSQTSDARLETQITRRKNEFVEIDAVSLSIEVQDLKDFIHRTPKRPDHTFQHVYKSEFNKIFTLIDKYLKKDLKRKIYKAKFILDEINDFMLIFEIKFAENKKKGLHAQFDPIEVAVIYELLNLLKNYIGFLSYIQNYKYIIKKPSESINDNFQNPLYKSDFYNLSFFSKNFYIHKPTLKYSIQGAIIILAVIWLWKYFEVPGGNLSIAIAVFVVILPETSACFTKGLMRFIGCTIGGIIGFGFLALQIESTFLMCILVFCAIYFCAYLQTGGSNISYLGRQAGYAFVIAFLPQAHPATEIDIVLNRFIGIFFGIGCVWSLRWFFWNDDVKANFYTHIKSIKKVFMSSSLIYRKLKKTPNSIIPFASTDISSAIVAIKVLDHNNEFSPEKNKLLMEWLNHMQQLFFRYEALFNTNKEFFEKTIRLRPAMTDLLFSISQKLSSNNFKNNTSSVEKDFYLLNNYIEDYPNYLREMFKTSDKTFSEKQGLMHILVLMRRIKRRLYRIFNLQKQLYSLDDNN